MLRRNDLFLASVLSAVVLGTALNARPRYTGVNLAGGEFGAEKKPGINGTDYIYPTAKAAAPFLDAGLNTVRVPVLWERIQRAPKAPLDPAEMSAFDASLAKLSNFDLIVIDVHNYAKYYGRRLDEQGMDPDLLPNLWAQLAERYRAKPNIAFGLMNEPEGVDARAWRDIASHTVRAIRATGATNLVLVPGTRWTGAHSWLAGGETSNAAALKGFEDPASNFAIEMHQYFDSDSSGTTTECVSPETAVKRMAGASEWLRANGYRGFLGEFGTSGGQPCLASLEALLEAMNREPAWIGWSYWAAGDWWGDYPLSVQPRDGVEPPQLKVLIRHRFEEPSSSLPN